jgi:hypothetical protein
VVSAADLQANAGVLGELDQVAIKNRFLLQADGSPSVIQIVQTQARALQASICFIPV